MRYLLIILGICLLPVVAFGAISQDQEQILVSNFTVDMGLGNIHVMQVEIDDLVIPKVPVTDIRQTQFTQYRPGQPQGFNIAMRIASHPSTRNVSQWVKDAAEGKQVRLNIVIALHSNARNDIRKYTFYDCMPVSYDPIGEPDVMGKSIASVSLKVRCNRVGITGIFNTNPADSNWSSLSGGTLRFNSSAGTVIGPDQFRDSTIGPMEVTELTLTGKVAGNRSMQFPQWLTTIFQEKTEESYRTVSIEASDSNNNNIGSLDYYECFITRYVFPVFDKDSGEAATESFVINSNWTDLNKMQIGIVSGGAATGDRTVDAYTIGAKYNVVISGR